MTGHGEAHELHDGVAVTVEIRTVNNRYLKVSIRTSEGYSAIESQLESLVRAQVRRGSVQVNAVVVREADGETVQLNEGALTSYLRQVERFCEKHGRAETIRIESLLALPGVASEQGRQNRHVETDWPLIERTARTALKNLARMRADEGAAMAADLHANCGVIAAEVGHIEQRAPVVIEAYRTRLLERLNKLLAQHEVQLETADVLRETALLADRSDIAEELVRLRSHLEQFDTIAGADESPGRKLEFLVQEMLREANTVGSKANDAEIARRVIEIKAAIERIREMLQNVE